MTEASAPKLIDPNVAQDLARLMLDLSHNKEYRKEIGKLVKKAKPESPHAAAFADVDIEDKFESFRAEQADRELKAQQQQVVDRMNGQRSRLLTGGENGSGKKYSEDDLKKIEALMQKKGVTDYDDGAVLYAATLPPENTLPSEIPNIQGTTWEFPEWGKFGKDPVKASREVAGQVIQEFMQRKRA
jgi:hypothetical protein